MSDHTLSDLHAGAAERASRSEPGEAAATGQISAEAAALYERFFVPALFAQWPPQLADAAAVGPGQRVLDVACGTGVLARALAPRVQPGGEVVGLDLNDGMLAVARRVAPQLQWRQGRAEALPFDDGAFDAVLSQFGLMFFADPVAALGEMQRVLRPGGRLAVAVVGRLEQSPGYAAVVELLQRIVGAPAADALRVPFRLGDAAVLRSLCERAGLVEARIDARDGRARFASIDDWIHTDVKGWTLRELIDDAQYAQLLAQSRVELRRFCDADGRVDFALPALIVSAIRR